MCAYVCIHVILLHGISINKPGLPNLRTINISGYTALLHGEGALTISVRWTCNPWHYGYTCMYAQVV